MNWETLYREAESVAITRGLEITKLTAERDALKEDAERYRFLKKGYGRCSFEIMEQCEEDGEYYGVSLVQGNYIDDKIDKEMKETKC